MAASDGEGPCGLCLQAINYCFFLDKAHSPTQNTLIQSVHEYLAYLCRFRIPIYYLYYNIIGEF